MKLTFKHLNGPSGLMTDVEHQVPLKGVGIELDRSITLISHDDGFRLTLSRQEAVRIAATFYDAGLL